jgi:hypothetical protein
MATEDLWFNPETGHYEGCDPDTYQNHGVIRELTAPTLEELKSKIEREYFSLDKPLGADVQIFDGRLEIQYQGEHDYRTPKEEQIPFIETVSIFISKVEETMVDLESESIFKNVAR